MRCDQMEDDNLLFDTTGNPGCHIRNLKVGSKYIPDKTACCLTCIPSQRKHFMRASIAVPPRGTIMFLKVDELERQVFIDEDRREWIREPDRCTTCSGPACCGATCYSPEVISLRCYDVPTIRESAGSTEIRVRMTDDWDARETFNSCETAPRFNFEGPFVPEIIAKGYNFKDIDQSSCCSHFWADLIPQCLYRKSRMTVVEIQILV